MCAIAGRPIFALTLVSLCLVPFDLLNAAPSRPTLHLPDVRKGEAYEVPNETYSEWVRSSQYVSVRDGTRLAIDIYRPAVRGIPVIQAMPVILIATPYHRANVIAGKLVDSISGIPNNLPLALLKHGYVIAALDIRGRGTSFGTVYGGVSETDQDRWDLYDVIEWLATQPWSNRNVGMVGCSYAGLTQLLAAESMPPHLKAIAPCGGLSIDFYSGLGLRPNGVSQTRFYDAWDDAMYKADITDPAPGVDGDTDGSLLKAAIAEHRISWDKGLATMGPARKARPFRDSPPLRGEYAYGISSDWNFVANFKMSKIPVLEYVGWRDLLPDQALAWYRSIARTGVSQTLIIGPWYHCEWYNSDLTDLAAEHIRWYDFWLKGIRNGADIGPKVRYYVVGEPAQHAWRVASQWPLPNQQPTKYFFGDGKPGPGASRGGGVLTRNKPATISGVDTYWVDYTVSTANLATRWYARVAQTPAEHPALTPIEMAGIDAKSLTYTTAPLKENVEVTGSPTLTLWAASSAKDLDFFVYLEEVDEQGRSTLMSDGVIRASNRATREAPFDNQGLPWHPSLKDDQLELPAGIPVKIELALYPMSNLIKSGHRIRVTINNFDKGQWDTPEISPAPMLSIFRDVRHASYITLPYITKHHS